jgi:hypothetical protein
MRPPLAALFLGFFATAEAQEEEIRSRRFEYEVEVDVSSRYLFRGVPFSEEPVTQITASAVVSGVTFYAWGNVLLKREPRQNDFNELDLGVSYAYQRGKLTLEPAFDAYVFRVPAPETAPHTTEGSIQVSWALGPAAVFTRQSVDLTLNRGAYYAEAGFSLERALSPRMSLSGVFTFAWASERFNSGHIGVAVGGWNHAGVELALTYAGERFYLRPHFELTSLARSAFRQHLAEPTVSRFGIGVGFFRD